MTNIEEDKEILKDKSKHLMNFLSNNIAETNRNKKLILKGLLLDIISTERSILSDINELDKSIKAGS